MDGNLVRAVRVCDSMHKPRAVLAWVLLASVIGCGVTQPEESPGPGQAERPTDAGELVLRVEIRGGLQPPLERERQLPAISIYGDGAVLMPAPVDAMFPGPAGYELDAFRIEADLLDEVVAAALAMGLHGEDRHLAQEGPAFVADAGATTVTLVTDDGRHVTTADALFETADTDTPARTQLRAFVERLYALRPTDAAPARYEPATYRVYVAAPDPGFGSDPAAAEPVAWPFPEPLDDWGEPLPADGLSVDVRCEVITAAELADVFEVLRAARATTIVMDLARDQAIVAYRPLLPDEEGCAAGG